MHTWYLLIPGFAAAGCLFISSLRDTSRHKKEEQYEAEYAAWKKERGL